MDWLDNLLASLDCYCWLFDQDLLSPLQMFTEKGSEKSSFFKSLTFFLHKVALTGIDTLGTVLPVASQDGLFTPLEVDEFSRGKCTVIIRMWNFFTVILRKHAANINKFVPKELWCEKLWILLTDCIVRPQSVGFNMADTETISMLPKEMEAVLFVFGRHLPDPQKKQFVACLRNHLITNCNLAALLPVSLTDEESDRASLAYVINGYKQLQAASYLANDLPGLEKGVAFAKTILDNVYRGIVEEDAGSQKAVKLSPTSKILANSLLALAFRVGVPTKDLVRCLMDKSKIETESHKVTVCHGDFFLACLRPAILDHLATSKQEEIGALCDSARVDSEGVSAILVAVLDHVGRDRTLRKREGMSLCNGVLGQWKKLDCLWGRGSSVQSHKLAFGILSKLVLIDSQVASNENHQNFPAVFEMYLSLLTDSSNPLNFKNQVLSLMPFFASVTKENEEKLKNAVNQFVAASFPMKSSEFSPGTSNSNDYISALNKILAAMEMTGSLVLLELVISVLCKEQRHVHESAMLDGIGRLVQRLPSAKQKPAFDVAYGIFTKEECFASDIRRIAVEKICLHMLQFATTASVIEFFSDHILELMQHVDTKLKTTEASLEIQLVNKIGTFQLLEGMFSRLNRDEVNSKSSTVNQKYCQGKAETGKEMTIKITKAAQEARSEDVRGETNLAELRRQYHCHAYNLLVTIISCVQTDAKFYKGFLFQENPAKGQFLLDNIISQDTNYEFTAELQAPLEQRRKFISLRKEVKEHQLKDSSSKNGDEEMSEYAMPSLHLASQYLADSSLSDDLGQYDFNQQVNTSGQNISGATTLGKKHNESTSSDHEPTEPTTANTLVLEMDALNQHECMAPIIGLLKHMQDCGISPQVLTGDTPKEMPFWMKYFHDKMNHSSTHVNCKLFIAKLIVNCSQLFLPYARFWFLPLFELLFSPDLCTQGITYFSVDLLVTMVSWHSAGIPQDKAMVSRLIRQLVCRIHHQNRQIFRNNLELLNTLLECWHQNVEIPYEDIYQYLKETEAKDGTQYVIGLQVLGLVVSNKFDVYGPTISVSKERYFQVLCKRMTHRLKVVHAASAEVIGMVLFKASQTDKSEEDALLDQVVTQLSAMVQQKGDNFIVCVHKIHGNYPLITKKLVTKLLFILPNLHGELRSMCLEILQTHVVELENAFVELTSKGLKDFLSHRDETTQLVSLRIVKSLMSKLDKKQMDSMITLVVGFSSHPSLSCRKVMLDILMWVFDNYRENEDETSLRILTVTKETLLKGLCDPELECRLICHNFWSSNMRTSEGTLDRIVSLLEAMYSTSTENQFLAYATNILLESTSKSPDYARTIFEHSLSECKFQEYSVQSSWHQRHAAMTPLFAVTQASQSMPDSWGEAMDESMDGDLRATMDAQQFSATMDVAAGGKPFNWLTQSSLDTFAQDASLGKETQMLFSIESREGGGSSKTAARRDRSSATGGQNTLAMKAVRGGPPPQASSSQATPGESKFSDVWRLKRRFLKDKEAQSAFFGRRQIRLKKIRESVRHEQKERRENEVTLYRKYRIGDLPDIQIKYQYIIAPLQALAHRDNKVASLLFSSLFKAIFAQIDTVKTENQTTEVVAQVKKSLENILAQTTSYYPPFITSILDILYQLRASLQVSPNEMATCAILSGQQNLGILLLEEQLIQMDSALQEPSSKRARTSQPAALNTDTAKWIELCRLFKSVHEYDALQGVFSDRLGTKDLTRKAIEAEARGDYKVARQFYEEATSCMDWADGDPLECEVNFWDDGRMESLNFLSQWHDLEKVSVIGVDSSDTPNLERVWDDPFYQEHYLPFVLRSKLKLVVDGSENQQDLLTFVDNAMTDPVRKELLQSRYSVEMALMSVWQGDYNRARHFAALSFDKFVQDWMSTTPMMALNRKDNLCHLQTLVEMQEFLDVVSREGSSVKPLYAEWQRRSPHDLLNSVTVWDDIVTNRSLYMDLLSAQPHSQSSTSSQDASMTFDTDEAISGQVEEMQTTLRLAMANSCRRQNNLALTLKLLRKTNSSCRKLASPSCISEWTAIYALTHHTMASTHQHPWAGDTFNNVLTTIDQLVKLKGNAKLEPRPDYKLWTGILIGQAFDTLTQGLMGLDRLDGMGTEVLAKVISHVPCNQDKAQLIEKTIMKGFEEMKHAASVDVAMPAGTQPIFGVEQANLDLAKYCDKYLRLQDEESLPADYDFGSFPGTVVGCLLNAIQGGSLEARERFPRVLQLAGQHPDVHRLVISKTAEIPCWMFLMWLSQMTALMDKPEGQVTLPILERIAAEYPQALVYPFTMSFEDLQFGNSPQDKKNKGKVDRISEMVNIPIITKFISALEQFSLPFMMFKDWTDDIKKLLSQKNKDVAKIKDCYAEIYETIIKDKAHASVSSVEDEDSPSLVTLSIGMGEYRKAFASTFKNRFDQAFGKEGDKLARMSIGEFGKAYKVLNDEYEGLKHKLSAPSKLKDYSRWLADFTISKYGKKLEIPGQYTGLKKPLPEYHIYVAGFAEKVLVMKSLRQPKKIVIRGNDERDHPYMVKGGEDLRLDQRIESLFYIMNQVMNADRACCQRKLQLVTYQVIPMNPRLGLIEWLNNTCVLQDFYNNAMTEEERKNVEGARGPRGLLQAWTIKAGAGKKRFDEIYDAVYLKCSSAETIREFRTRESKVPWDLSRRALKQMSASAAAFHVLRNRLVTSHATVCVCQYLLGIGDRHLGNFMVNAKTGHMIGIDFGHAFGTATQFLPVPELMPFRLTSQLVNLTLPMMQAKGLMEGTMRHVLRAMRKDSDLLYSTMDVFIKEPSMDWKNFAEKQMKQQGLSEDGLEQSEQWFPRKKIEIAKRKLEGDHPSHIMRDELETSALRKRAAFKKYAEVLMGSNEQVRAGLSPNKLSVEDQVAALINQATDPNLLGRVYVGWSSWM